MEEDKPPLKVTLLSQLEGKVRRANTPAPTQRPRPGPSKPRFQETKPPKPKTTGPRKKGAKEPTQSRLMNIALYQIAQRELSSQGLRDILTRRMLRWLHTLDSEEVATQRAAVEERIEGVVATIVKDGMIDDIRFAEMKTRGWRDRGWGERRIMMELKKKGIEGDAAQDALRSVDEDVVDIADESVRSHEVERLAADTLAQKRRLGPYRLTPAPSDRDGAAKLWRREAGILARAGFGFDIINEILSAAPEEED